MHQTKNENRIYFLDNLRTVMIFLVVLLHAGLVYESTGGAGFFWIVYDFSTNPVVDEINLILDIFIMPIIFFISGYFALISLRKKSVRFFVMSKLKRLFIPWLIAAAILIPIFKMMFLASRGMAQEHWTTYFHFTNGIISQSWLWFLPVLFLFNLIYAGCSQLDFRMPYISIKAAVTTVFLIGLIYSIFMDVFGLQGWTKNAFVNFQNERILIYALIFFLGTFFSKMKVFEGQFKNKKVMVVAAAMLWLPLLSYRYFYINDVWYNGGVIFSDFIDTVLLWTSFHLFLLAILIVLIFVFWLYLNRSTTLSKELTANSYTIYIIHPIIIGLLAWPLLNIEWPSVIKFIALASAAYLISTVIASLYRRFIRSILN